MVNAVHCQMPCTKLNCLLALVLHMCACLDQYFFSIYDLEDLIGEFLTASDERKLATALV